MNTSQDPDLKFRCSLRMGVLSGIVWTGLVSCLMFAPLCFLLNSIRYPAWGVYIILCSVGLLFGMIVGGFYSFAYPISVRRDGIYGYNFWSSYSMVLWDEIIDIEPIQYLGFSYLKAFFEGSTAPLWIPLFLAKQDKFVTAVVERAPEGNPLRRALLGDFRTSAASNQRRLLAKNSETLMEFLSQAAEDFEDLIKSFLRLIAHPQQLRKAIHTHYFTTQSLPHSQPWMQPTVFPNVPIPNTFGYQKRKKNYACSQQELRRQVERDPQRINLVWTPESTRLQPPEEISFLYQIVQSHKLTLLKQQQGLSFLYTAMFGFLILGGIASATKTETWNSNSQFNLLMFINLGLIPLFQNTWSICQLQTMKLENMSKWISEIRFWRWVGIQKTPWTKLLLNCIILVGIVQFLASIQTTSHLNSSPVMTAGIVKSAVWSGEGWRLLTGTLLHVNLIHFCFNLLALWGLAMLVEVLTHPLYVPIVFMLSALMGSIMSLALLPETTSVGASGGIMGLLGFLVILTLKQRKYFPSAIVQMLLINVVYITVMGVAGYQIIDNAAHFGGFMGGMLLATLLIPSGKTLIPAVTSSLTKVLAAISTMLLFGTTVFSVFKMLIV
jgi:membrane associated rhomboid family serine protease